MGSTHSRTAQAVGVVSGSARDLEVGHVSGRAPKRSQPAGPADAAAAPPQQFAAADDRPLSPLVQFTCQACGSALAFEPTKHALECAHCGTLVCISLPARTIPEQPLDEVLAQPRRALSRVRSKRVRCGKCGAGTTTRTVSGLCPFCGAPGAVDWDFAEHIPPDGVISFVLNTATASAALKLWLSRRWFLPRSLRQLATEEGALAGVYLPLWTFDARTCTVYTGERGTAYYVPVTISTGDGKTVTTVQRHVAWCSASGRTARTFDDVIVPASSLIPAKHIARLCAWDWSRLEHFDVGFLAGFVGHHYDVDLADGFRHAKGIMEGVIEDDCRADIGGDEQHLWTVNTQYSATTFKHVLVPVWTGTFVHKARTFNVYVDGVTGRVTGDRPYSVPKIVALVLLALVLGAGLGVGIWQIVVHW